MLKEDCIHQVAWALVPPNARIERPSLPFALPEGVELQVFGGNFGAPSLSPEADILEAALNGACRDLPEELDLKSSHFGAVEQAVRGFFQDVQGATLASLSSDANSPVLQRQDKVLSKLRELADEELNRAGQ